MKVHKNEMEKTEMEKLSQVLDEIRQLRAEVARLTQAIESHGPLLPDEGELFEENVELLFSMIQDGATSHRDVRERCRVFRKRSEFDRHMKPLIESGRVAMSRGQQKNWHRFHPTTSHFQNKSNSDKKGERHEH